MKEINFKIQRFLVLMGCFILFLFPMSPCAETTLLKTQGLINPGGNLKAGYLVINEMKVHLSKKTQVMDEGGFSVSPTELKPKKWVYVEIEKNSIQKMNLAKKIYLLPSYVPPEDRKKFPFMN